MILFIDTASFDKLHFALLDPISGKFKEKRIPSKYSLSEKTASHLESFLKSNAKFFGKNSWRKSLTKIIVVSGPGSFTGIRTGVSIALAFGMALGLDVYAIKKDQIPKKISDLLKLPKSFLKKITTNFEANYGAEPNITAPASTYKPKR